MAAPVAVAAAWGIGKVAVWLTGIIAAAWATKKVTDTFGNSPKNDLQQIGVPPERIYEDAKKYREDKRNYLDNLNKEDKREIKDLQDKLDALEKEKVNLAQEIKEARNNNDDRKEKMLLAKEREIDKKIASITSQLQEKKDQVQKREEKITDVFTQMGDPTTMTKDKYITKASNFSWSSYRNWGIIAICIIVSIMILGFIKKLFSSLLSSIK